MDQVREELRRLGYLETGLDRFVLGGAGARSPLRASLEVALRVGVAGGALLGGCLVVGAVALDARLVSEPADLLVLALYLVLAAGAASALLTFFGGVAAAALVRRVQRAPGPGLTRSLGLAVSFGALVYAALWWRSHAAAAPLWLQLTAALVGVGLALALGRLASLSVVAVLSASGLGDALPRAELTRRRLLPLLAAAALLIAAGVGAVSLLVPEDAPAPDFAVVPTRLHVRVLGVDGLDLGMVEQLRARGELTNLSRLIEGGASWTLAAEPEAVPAIVWTTYATGRGPAAHGIRAAGAVRLAGMSAPVSPPGRLAEGLRAAADLLKITRTQPATAPLRGSKAFWSVAAEKGLGVGIVNWWATWPAEEVAGFLVSDRAFFKLERGGPADREVHPPEAFEVLAGVLARLEGRRAERIDRFQLEAARRLRGSTAPDLEAVYLAGLDIVTLQQLGQEAAGDLAGLDARLEQVRNHYRFFDARLGELMDSLGEADVVMLVGDPGRFARRAPRTPEGLLVLSGPVVEPGAYGTATGRDIAPTILYLCGLPVSDELEGEALVGALAGEFRERHPLRHVSSYGRGARERATPSSFDPQLVEELKALGYIP